MTYINSAFHKKKDRKKTRQLLFYTKAQINIAGRQGLEYANETPNLYSL